MGKLKEGFVLFVILGLFVSLFGEESGAGHASSSKDSSAVVSAQVAIPKKASKKTLKNKKKPVTQRAKTELETAIRYYREGIKTGDNKPLNTALVHIRAALKESPGYSAAYYYAGVIRRRFGQDEMARVNFEKSVTDPDLGYNAHFYLGKMYGESEKYPEAIRHLNAYRDATDYEPGRREAFELIDRYSKALGLSKTILHADIGKMAQDDIAVEIYDLPSQKPLAEIEIPVESLFTMIVVDTVSEQGRAMLEGVHLFNKKEYDKAISSFRSVMAKYPQGRAASNSVYNCAICFLKLHDWERAARELRNYQERYSEGTQRENALFFEAIAQQEMQKNSDAQALFQTYIQKYRNGKWVGKSYEKLGDISVETDQLTKAADAYKLANTYGKSVEDQLSARYKLGEMYRRLENWSAAEKNYRDAISLGEQEEVAVHVPHSYYRIADRYYQQKQWKNALDEYLRVTRLHPDYSDTPWGLFQIGNCHRHMENWVEAIAAYDTLSQRHPDDYWTSQAEWKRKDAVWQYEYRGTIQ